MEDYSLTIPARLAAIPLRNMHRTLSVEGKFLQNEQEYEAAKQKAADLESRDLTWANVHENYQLHVLRERIKIYEQSYSK